MSSLKAADDIQLHRIERNERGGPTTITKSTKAFAFANGGRSGATYVAKQPITSGLLNGETIDFHLIDLAGNRTAPLLSIKEMSRLRMIVDFEEGSICFKSQPNKWFVLPKTPTGLLLLPVTQHTIELNSDLAYNVVDDSLLKSSSVVPVQEAETTEISDVEEDNEEQTNKYAVLNGERTPTEISDGGA